MAASNPAMPGDVVTMYGTGWDNTATVTVGGQKVNVLFAGEDPSFAGLDQASIQLPANIASGALPVVLTVGGVESNTAILPVGPDARASRAERRRRSSGGTASSRRRRPVFSQFHLAGVAGTLTPLHRLS